MWHDFIVYYGEEENEFRVLTERFGTKCTNDKGQKEYRINYAKFTEAVLEGRIPRWPIPVLRREFNKIASKGKYGLQNITINDMKKYYEEEEYTSEQLDDIMAKFGISSEGEWKLFFHDFKRAVNTGRLPEPKIECVCGRRYKV
ncbi:uncharacterized protein LOC126834870 [Adelges cooleyi]|uniref:uncharacterized protein LOC126834870 n=1 Tax=Adelges cooleyi TaxID=133065 RepID=UPI00217F4997|nr:uncharacterized protein LOC126834870 [Adelges cooleyi]